MTLTLEAPRTMTRRTPTLHQQAGSVAARLPTQGLTATRRALLDLAALARTQGDQPAYRAVVTVMVDVRAAAARELAAQAAAAMRDKRQPTGDDIITRWLAQELGAESLAPASPARLHREARQRAVLDETQQRDAERWAANAVAQALWAVHQGEREWEAIPTRPTTLPASTPTGQGSGSVMGPAQLTVSVPARRDQPRRTLVLYRADYDRLLALWGYGQVVQAHQHRTALLGSAPVTTIDALVDMAIQSATHPNFARSWHGYVTGARLGDVFREHTSGSLQLSPNRSGDLREAVLEIARQCREVAYQPQSP